MTWASSDDKVVTVDKTGKVTAVAKGVAKVTATTANGKSASVTVTVTEDSEVPGPTGPTEPTKPGTEKPTTKPTTKPNDGKLSATGADTAVLATICGSVRAGRRCGRRGSSPQRPLTLIGSDRSIATGGPSPTVRGLLVYVMRHGLAPPALRVTSRQREDIWRGAENARSPLAGASS